VKPGSPAIGGQRRRGRAACKDLVDRDQQLPNREDFNTTLGLPPAATPAQVKAAYLAALGEARPRAAIGRLHAAYWVPISPRLRGMHDAELAGPQEVAKKRLFDEMDARGTLEPIDRGLAGSDGAASGRLPLLASSFLPLTLLGEERRREETAGAFLELLPRARISIQHAAIATVHGVANRFPPAEAPRQRRSSRSGPGWKPTRPLRTGSGASSRPRTCCPRSTLAT